jgi:hypothetical protein
MENGPVYSWGISNGPDRDRDSDALRILIFGIAARCRLGEKRDGPEFFKMDYTLFLNMGFLLMSAGFVGWKMKQENGRSMGQESLSDKILFWLAVTAFVWLAGGLLAGVWTSQS